VKAKERGLRNNSGDEYKRMLALESGAPGSEDRLVPFSGDELCGEARRALEDFGFFRYRYFGRRSTPWQEEAGHQVVAWLATKQKEYAVVNCPPGSGKTTLFTHDIPAWLTCRNRGIRGMPRSRSRRRISGS
jgi:predicted NACHT family NTPase